MKNNRTTIVCDDVADNGWPVYEALWSLIHDDVGSYPFGRKEIPSFEQFLRGFHLPVREWLRSLGFEFSAAEVEDVLHPLAGNLEKFLDAR